MADWENRQGNKDLHERLLFGRKVVWGTTVLCCKNQSPVLLTDQSSYTEERGRDLKASFWGSSLAIASGNQGTVS